MKQRDTFSSKTGFVLTCVGSAVGLGNLWLFPWRIGQYGGGTFLVLYFFFVYVLGTTGLMGEYGLGRWAGRGPMGAFDKILRGKGLRFGRVLGAYPVLAALGILVFYGIVTGWVVRSLTLPGSLEGIKYLFIPDGSYLLKPVTWGMALGQAFFTVSLGGSSMVVYASYMRHDMDVPSAALQTVSLLIVVLQMLFRVG